MTGRDPVLQTMRRRALAATSVCAPAAVVRASRDADLIAGQATRPSRRLRVGAARRAALPGPAHRRSNAVSKPVEEGR